MRSIFLFHALCGMASPKPYYAMTVFAPDAPSMNGKVINANDRSFVIGALRPTTYCPHAQDCPGGNSTLINSKMTLLASAVPGGQDIYVAPDGSISYSPPHSAYRPAGAQIGGFRASRNVSKICAAGPVTLLSWQDESGVAGLWACRQVDNASVASEAVLKASTLGFQGEGCSPVEGVVIWENGDDYGAWAYS